MAFKEREDTRGGLGYNQFSRVRLENLWRDRVRREKELFAKSTPSGFQMNLVNACASGGFLRLRRSHNRLETVTEKEIKQSPQARMCIESMDPDSLEVRAIKHIGRVPSEKFDVPVTSAQESSWLLSNPVRASTLSPPLPKRRSSSTGRQELIVADLESTMPGCLVHRPLVPLRSTPAVTVTAPTSESALARQRSAPALCGGPPLDELRKLNNRRWYRPKGSCDVTIYANAYATMNHCSPFEKAATGRL